MKAIRLHRQGGPEQLVYEDAPNPELDTGDALIRVHARHHACGVDLGGNIQELRWV